MTEKPKARLTIEQHQQAINEAIWIDASPHEWPTLEKVPLLCNALLDSVVMVDYFMKRLAAVEAERDAAQAGEARALEALDVFARAYRVSMLPFAPGIDEADGAHHWMPHGWPSVADFKLANSVLSDSSALSWLAQQRREAAAEENDRWANEWWEFPRPDSLTASDFTTRAAALRAGEVGNE